MTRKRPYVIGITGNIACGKSLVVRELAACGAETVDADEVAREVTGPGSPVLAAIAQEFGAEVLRPDGSLDRRALGAIVFRDPEALRRLEAITHPAIVAEIRRRVAESRRPVVVIDAIKLFESSLARDCDEVWVVTCRPEQQLARLMARNGLSEEEALTRIRAQPPQEEKVARADRVIDNSGSIEETRRQVAALWQDVLARIGCTDDPALAGPAAPSYTAAEQRSDREENGRDASAETDPDP
ncbi:dephospho-CoA kinase [Thermomicrobium sp. 4228-Ro]|uniref:dephospho-CoA kinase n=1 Tax=Thermomicrobium sp. 4228-Ro TaxID=2993937 RepID=UPI002249964C|nr:dephospho-CoA kinase [Thermomicrobium sp. 4228-Ro]MCX2726849.1 dephospho-CoA kinase [Thermomicrobium sp. 4228-Ro]